MRHIFVFFLWILPGFILPAAVRAQSRQALSSTDILMGLKKLNVLGSVLYVAAHPDDERNQLMAYFAKEKLYRTGYLSLTRGEGGQNLIGNEQGVELGLIRTQELLAARRVDGAEQFFSRAYDFGFSKSTDEALKSWDKQKILSDVVWVIRTFQPDVIITRFPQDSRAGHGQHSASAVLAVEAFTAAADPAAFPEQLKWVKPWQAKRVMMNAFSFGSNSTQSEDQLKVDAGLFNPLLGRSYGEIAAESRSQHKSQGVAIPGQRGASLEYFSTWKGDVPRNDLMDDVNISWGRVKGGVAIQQKVDSLISGFVLFAPGRSVKPLISLWTSVAALEPGYWRNRKLEEIQQLIEACSGLWVEATSRDYLAVQNEGLQVNFVLNNRNGNAVALKGIKLEKFDTVFTQQPLVSNKNFTLSRSILIGDTTALSQPYWLKHPMKSGYYDIREQQQIGKAENPPSLVAKFLLNIEGKDFEVARPVQQKYTDPVRGELYQPIVVVPPLLITPEKNLLIAHTPAPQNIHFSVKALKDVSNISVSVSGSKNWLQEHTAGIGKDSLTKGSEASAAVMVKPLVKLLQTREDTLVGQVKEKGKTFSGFLRSITYEHIPSIHYFRTPTVNMLSLDLNIAGKRIGYIEGAGDYVPAALQQMGFEVIMLTDVSLAINDLSQYDAIITGVRAYDTKPSLFVNYERLMHYVEGGGNLIVQYNRSNLGLMKSNIGPYPFSVSSSRITDEHAPVKVLKPEHPVFNYPNKITQKDFEGWVQERSIYHAQNWDNRYETLIAMHDPGEKDDEGSLIVGKYGKGNFVYTGLVFFRELPAGVPGAYRLLANLIALGKKKGF